MVKKLSNRSSYFSINSFSLVSRLSGSFWFRFWVFLVELVTRFNSWEWTHAEKALNSRYIFSYIELFNGYDYQRTGFKLTWFWICFHKRVYILFLYRSNIIKQLLLNTSKWWNKTRRSFLKYLERLLRSPLKCTSWCLTFQNQKQLDRRTFIRLIYIRQSHG